MAVRKPAAKAKTRKPAPKPAPARKPAPKPKAARKVGQPPHEPTEADRYTVQVMVAGGIAQSDIARARGLSVGTLRKHYRHEIATGATTLNTVAIIAHVKRMRAGDFQAIKWWEQSRMGWAEHVVVDAGKQPATPMRVVVELVGDPAQPRADDSAPRSGSHLPDNVRNSVKFVG
jgi:hypothetical protein